MRHRRLGTSDLELPVVSFGAWAIGGWMWSGADTDAAVRAMQRAVDEGMTCIDTAPMYGCGQSERLVGEAIKGRRDKVIVATKLGMRWDLEEGEFFFDSVNNEGESMKVYKCSKPHSIMWECEQSLKRLGVDVIDLYQCHWPDRTTPVDDIMETLCKLREQGKIRAFGVSNYDVALMEECLKTCQIASNQPRYNMLEREIEDDLMPFCREHNIGLLIYSTIYKGLLTGKVTMDSQYDESDVRSTQRWFKPENRAKAIDFVEKLRPIAEAHDATIGQVAINWVISQPGVTTALVGARTEEQVVQNAGAANFELTGEELTQIRTMAEALG